MNVLLAGQGYPMWATHDPRLIEIARARAMSVGRAVDTYEFQMLYGIRPDEQRKLAAGRPHRAGLPALRRSSGTATSCAGWPSVLPT